ncbi:MAG: hypothetical protein O7I93_02125 [Gemmatimonadetes bacterium]|nr:hypothetical protein [Gemmatimonadota bacterium]
MAAIPRLHVERRSSPERGCEVCLKGVYVTRLETDSSSGAGALRQLGIDTSEQDVLWHVEGCNHCGHVLIFRRDWRSPSESASAEDEHDEEDEEG